MLATLVAPSSPLLQRSASAAFAALSIALAALAAMVLSKLRSLADPRRPLFEDQQTEDDRPDCPGESPAHTVLYSSGDRSGRFDA